MSGGRRAARRALSNGQCARGAHWSALVRGEVDERATIGQRDAQAGNSRRRRAVWPAARRSLPVARRP